MMAESSAMHQYAKGALEAILMVVSEPVTLKALAFAIDQPEPETEALLRELQTEYSTDSDTPRGFQLREVGGGWRFYSNPRYADIVAEFVTSSQSSRLSQAALETLAVVAYRQPVTRTQIAAIRGVEVDSVVRTLTTRGLIEVVGVTNQTGASLYGTTALFLEKMGMNNLNELAPLAPYLPDESELEDVEKELG